MQPKNTTIQKPKTSSVIRQGLRWRVLAAAVGLAGACASSQASGAVVVLGQGDNLQAALDHARRGDVIRLEPGAVFEGNFELPATPGPGVITIRSAAEDAALPGPAGRIGPEHEAFMPTIKSPNAQPALRTRPGSRDWAITAVRFLGNGGADVVVLGDAGQASYADVPSGITLDRVVVRGHPARGQKRGIALNSASTTIRNCYIADIRLAGQETQGIAGWNGPGPYVIENNHIEAAGINVLFGGAEPSIGHLVPSDIVVRRNHFTKDLSWRGTAWTVKNLFELKNARRVLIEGNIFEHNWAAAQAGYAILFTVRSSGSRASWSTVEDVTFRHNVVRHVAAGINILGRDTGQASRQAHGILIRNNLFHDIDHRRWGGNGTFLQVGEEPASIAVEHNTIVQSGNLITAYGGTRTEPRPIRGFRFTDNVALHNAYGIFGSGRGTGLPAIAWYFPDSTIENNVLAGGRADRYPAGNSFPSVAALMAEFADPEAGDYRLAAGSALRSAQAGVDFEALAGAQAGADPVSSPPLSACRPGRCP